MNSTLSAPQGTPSTYGTVEDELTILRATAEWQPIQKIVTRFGGEYSTMSILLDIEKLVARDEMTAERLPEWGGVIKYRRTEKGAVRCNQ